MLKVIVVSLVAMMSLSSWAVRVVDCQKERPFLAIWRDSDGMPLPGHYSKAPYLRIAIWSDGRIVFAQDPKKWNHKLREGKIDSTRLPGLKKAIEKTGVFRLEGNCYLVPDAPVEYIMLDLDEEQQMLCWDEVEVPGYGINIQQTPAHLEFIHSWKKVNKLALTAIPTKSRPHEEPFKRTPESWRLKKRLQSK